MFGFGPAFAELIRPKHGYQLTDSDLMEVKRRERMSQDCGEELERIHDEWDRVFERLDEADGQADGRIDRKALVKWVSALDLQKTIDFEANLNITPRELERLVSKADHNKDGYVDRCEFLRLVSNRDKDLSKKQQSLLHQYLQVAAYAEEYSCWPPPFFIPCLTALQVSVYIYHIVHFLSHKDHAGVRITWSGPEPSCSQLIYNPHRRYEFRHYIESHAKANPGALLLLLQSFPVQ